MRKLLDMRHRRNSYRFVGKFEFFPIAGVSKNLSFMMRSFENDSAVSLLKWIFTVSIFMESNDGLVSSVL